MQWISAQTLHDLQFCLISNAKLSRHDQHTRRGRSRNLSRFFPLGALRGASNAKCSKLQLWFFPPPNTISLSVYLHHWWYSPPPYQLNQKQWSFHFCFFHASFPISTLSPDLDISYPILFLLLIYIVISLLYYFKIFLPAQLTLPPTFSHSSFYQCKLQLKWWKSFNGSLLPQNKIPFLYQGQKVSSDMTSVSHLISYSTQTFHSLQCKSKLSHASLLCINSSIPYKGHSSVQLADI